MDTLSAVQKDPIGCPTCKAPVRACTFWCVEGRPYIACHLCRAVHTVAVFVPPPPKRPLCVACGVNEVECAGQLCNHDDYLCAYERASYPPLFRQVRIKEVS